MGNRERTWAILLTGGGEDPLESKRQTLLEMTLSRARSIAPRDRIVAVIERAAKRHWNESLGELPRENVIVQPHHQGSAIEVLLAVLTMLERDPWARIVVMPSHRYVSDEAALAGSLLDAAIPTAQTRNNLALIGINQVSANAESGYIVPGRWFEDGTRSVLSIVKPSATSSARQLAARGALLDSAIVAARALVLIGVLRVCVPDLVDQIETALAQGDAGEVRQRALANVYSRLPSVDLSQVLAHGAASVCRVITSRSWSNLPSVRGSSPYEERRQELRPGRVS